MVTALPPLTDAGEAAVDEAKRIIAASKAAYAACKTYEDIGKLDEWDRNPGGAHNVIEFRTAFAGPHALRFAYRQRHEAVFGERLTQVVADDGGTQVMHSEGRPPRSVNSLGVIYGLASVSRGLSTAIIPLLPAGVPRSEWFHNWLDLQGWSVTGHGDLDGTGCDKLEAAYRRGTLHVQLWIAQSDSLLRRVVEDAVQDEEDELRATVEWRRAQTFPSRNDDGDASLAHRHQPLNTFSVTTYHPRCNQPIAPEALRATDGGL
jgi:hypothetical protein